MPGKSRSRCAAITSSWAVKRPVLPTRTQRSSMPGTLTRAKRCWSSTGSYITTARFNDKSEDEREGMARIHCQRRQHGKHSAFEM